MKIEGRNKWGIGKLIKRKCLANCKESVFIGYGLFFSRVCSILKFLSQEPSQKNHSFKLPGEENPADGLLVICYKSGFFIKEAESKGC